MIFEIWIPGKAVAWARPGQRSLKDGRVIRYEKDKPREWKSLFALSAQAELARAGHRMPLFAHPTPVRLVIIVGAASLARKQLRRRPSGAGWNVASADWDNLGKLVSDAGNHILWSDDRQIVSAHVEKVRMQQGDPAGVAVFAESVGDLRLDEASIYLQRARQMAGLWPEGGEQ